MAENRSRFKQLNSGRQERCVEHIPRLHGSGKHHIQYRHIIDVDSEKAINLLK